jgi:hypothetical protein
MTVLKVIIAEAVGGGWCVALRHPDGSGYVCEQRYKTKEEAAEMFDKWVAANPGFDVQRVQ